MNLILAIRDSPIVIKLKIQRNYLITPLLVSSNSISEVPILFYKSKNILFSLKVLNN